MSSRQPQSSGRRTVGTPLRVSGGRRPDSGSVQEPSTRKDSMTTNGAVPQRRYLLQLSTTNVPLQSGQTLEIGSACYLIEMSNGNPILIDTGIRPDVPTAGMPP